MKSTAQLIDQYKSVVDNNRTHSVVVDLPETSNGTDAGPTALELSLMSLSGCISTIFAQMAKKMRMDYQDFEVVVEGEKSADINTIGWVHINVSLVSDESRSKIEKCLDKTMDHCPVGVLFKRAGVEINTEIELETPQTVMS